MLDEHTHTHFRFEVNALPQVTEEEGDVVPGKMQLKLAATTDGKNNKRPKSFVEHRVAIISTKPSILV